MVDLNNKIYASFRISGLERLGIDDVDRYFELDQKYRPMIKMEFLVTKNDPNQSYIHGINVIYEDGVKLDRNTLYKTMKFIERVILITSIQTDTIIDKFDVSCDSYTDSDKTNIMDAVGMRDKVKLVCSHPLNTFEEIIQTDNVLYDPNGVVFEEFELLKAISKVSDLSSRYLLEYQMLVNLVKELNRNTNIKQKDVKDFVLNRYNPAQAREIFKIGKKPTRLAGKNHDEDCLTWYRNILAHPPIEQDEQVNLNEIDINGILKKINHVLLFAIKEKFNVQSSKKVSNIVCGDKKNEAIS